MKRSQKLAVLVSLACSGLAAAEVREVEADGTIQTVTDGPEWSVSNLPHGQKRSFRFRVARDFAGQQIRVEPFINFTLQSTKWTEARTECKRPGGVIGISTACMLDAQGKPVTVVKNYNYHRLNVYGTFTCEDNNTVLERYAHNDSLAFNQFEKSFADSIRWSVDSTDCTNFRVEYQYEGQNATFSALEFKVLAITPL